MEFNEKLHELRKRKGLAQEELAERLNMSKNTHTKLFKLQFSGISANRENTAATRRDKFTKKMVTDETLKTTE